MAFELSTDDVLAAIRSAIGASVTVGEKTLTWTKLIEGPALLWLDEPEDYPLIIMEPQDTEAGDAPSLIALDLPVDIHVVVKASNAGTGAGKVAPAAYKTMRLIGEAVVAKLMNAGPRLGTDWLERHLQSAGVNYGLCEQYNEHGLLVYSMQFRFRYYESEVGA